MSLSQSGNNFHHHTYSFPMTESSQVGEARRFANALCDALQFEEVRKARIGIIANELGNNLVRYTSAGTLMIRRLSLGSREGIEILSMDSGPGLDVSLVMQDGYTTGTTPGTGLGAVRRQSDEFDIYSSQKGSLVVARVYGEDMSDKSLPQYEVGAVSIPLKGEQLCGDAWCVHQTGAEVKALVVDGLGHGPAANNAAVEAVGVFNSGPDLKPDILLQLIHGRLKSTRGGAVFLLEAGPLGISYVGAGNIRALMISEEQSKTLISQNGTAGLQIRTSKILLQSWNGKEHLVLHSDGIGTRWDLQAYPGILYRHPAIIAAAIYRDHQRGTDDATVVVLRKRR